MRRVLLIGDQSWRVSVLKSIEHIDFKFSDTSTVNAPTLTGIHLFLVASNVLNERCVSWLSDALSNSNVVIWASDRMKANIPKKLAHRGYVHLHRCGEESLEEAIRQSLLERHSNGTPAKPSVAIIGRKPWRERIRNTIVEFHVDQVGLDACLSSDELDKYTAILIGWPEQPPDSWGGLCDQIRSCQTNVRAYFGTGSTRASVEEAQGVFAAWEHMRPNEITREYLRRLPGMESMAPRSESRSGAPYNSPIRNLFQNARLRITSLMDERSIASPISRHLDVLRCCLREQLEAGITDFGSSVDVVESLRFAFENAWLAKNQSIAREVEVSNACPNDTKSFYARFNEPLMLVIFLAILLNTPLSGQSTTTSVETRNDTITVTINNVCTNSMKEILNETEQLAAKLSKKSLSEFGFRYSDDTVTLDFGAAVLKTLDHVQSTN